MTTSTFPHTLGWIGAGGRMGFAMAKRLLAPLGAKIAASPRALADRDIVFSTVSASPDLIAVVTGPDGLLAGERSPQLFVDCSSVSEEASAEARAACERRGTAMLAAPVS